ncbi:anti-sigma factor [Marinifilum sp. JC070]|uniref:Anti-sigma factor n=2 Tax=Marinifilum caeruleilacunae TaxID=2499076 RepID=A0ABX1WR44_9BACT|nr:anti-sigma factor [Marinifilum caeruleilacunae]
MFVMRNLLLFAAVSLFVFSACDDDDDVLVQDRLSLNISGLEDLGDDYAYEGWLIVNGKAVSAGIFNVDGSGALSQNSFAIDSDDLANASAYVLTIEPSPDSDPGPSSVHILAGDFSGNQANLSVGHSSAIGSDFSTSTGSYILATPTDGADTNENSGVWWLDPSAGPGAALNLPNLPAGWKYEGWAVIDGVPVTTGKFTSLDSADESAAFSGSQAGPPFPGEDFLMNAPSGLTFPTDLAGATVVISVEPEPDNSAAPFLLKPLVGMVPSDAADHTLYDMSNNAQATNPTGSVTR